MSSDAPASGGLNIASARDGYHLADEQGEGKTFSPFEFGGHVTEIGAAGIVALRLERNIEWDGKAMKVKGAGQASSLIDPEPRKGWQ